MRSVRRLSITMTLILICSLSFTIVPQSSSSVIKAAAGPTLKKCADIEVGSTGKLTVKKNGFDIKKVTAKSNNKKIVKVTKITKSSVVLKGIINGSAKVTVYIKASKNKKKYKTYKLSAKIYVKEKESSEIRTVSDTEFDTMVNKAEERAKEIINNVTEIKKSDTYIPGETYTGTAYYVSESGDDSNNGLTDDTSWKTLKKIDTADLRYGDAVFFKRGDIFRGHFETKKGVTYSAYGTGEMPKLFSSPENGADPSYWTKYGDTPDGGTVWIYHIDMADCGAILVNDDKVLSVKVTPNWNGKYYETMDGDRFDILEDMDKDLSFFSPAESLLPDRGTGRVTIAGVIRGSMGKFYMRCDDGNPGEVFDSIEFFVSETNDAVVNVCSDYSVVNNLDVRFSSNVGVGMVNMSGSVVQNCEISYSGGNIGFYEDKVPECGGSGICGNGIDCTIRNTYIHDNCDQAVTLETGISDLGVGSPIEGWTISGNVFRDHANQGVHFMDFCQNPDDVIEFKNMTVENNYLYQFNDSWSYERKIIGVLPGGIDVIACIQIGDINKRLKCDNFVVRGNTMYSKTGAPIWGAMAYENPVFTDNTFLVYNKNMPVAIYSLPYYENFVWYRINGKGEEDVLTFLNKTVGSSNRIILRK